MNNKQETIYTNEDIIKYTTSQGFVEMYLDVAEYNKSSNEENIKNILKNINLEINWTNLEINWTNLEINWTFLIKHTLTYVTQGNKRSWKNEAASC